MKNLTLFAIALAASSVAASAADVSVIFRASETIVNEVPQTGSISFQPQTELVVGKAVQSAAARYTGPVVAASTSPGDFRICANAACSGTASSWSAAASVKDGDWVQLRLPGPTSAGAGVTATFVTGSTSAQFVATASSEQPSLGTFVQANAPAGTTAVSDLATFRGLMGAPISVASGEYRICAPEGGCSAYGSAASTIDHGQQVQLRASAPTATNSSKDVVVSVGSVSRTWTLRSDKDTTPEPFVFVQSSAAPATLTTSSIVALVGHDGLTVRPEGSADLAYRICSDATCSTNPAFTTAATDIPADTPATRSFVQARVTSNAAAGSTVVGRIVAGALHSDWTVLSLSPATLTVSPSTVYVYKTPANQAVVTAVLDGVGAACVVTQGGGYGPTFFKVTIGASTYDASTRRQTTQITFAYGSRTVFTSPSIDHTCADGTTYSKSVGVWAQ